MATSLESQVIPPQPEHTPPRAGDNVSDNDALIARPWAEWFNRIRIKVNLINESLANLSGTVGAGFLVGNSGNWLFRNIEPVINQITISNQDGVIGNPIIGLADTGVTPGTYGDASNIPVITVDSKGRITNIITVPIAAGPTIPAKWSTLASSSSITISNSGRTATKTAAGNSYVNAICNKLISGQRYFEIKIDTDVGPSPFIVIGVCTSSVNMASYIGADAYGWGYYQQTGETFHNSITLSYGALYAVGDVIGVAIDSVAGTLEFFKNGVSQGIAYTGVISSDLYAAVSLWRGSSGHVITANFALSDFVYSPPVGYLPI